MKSGMTISGGTLEMLFFQASNGGELSKRAAQAGIAAISPSGRAAFLSAARTLIEWFEEVEGEQSAHRGVKKPAAKKAKKGGAK